MFLIIHATLGCLTLSLGTFLLFSKPQKLEISVANQYAASGLFLTQKVPSFSCVVQEN